MVFSKERITLSVHSFHIGIVGHKPTRRLRVVHHNMAESAHPPVFRRQNFRPGLYNPQGLSFSGEMKYGDLSVNKYLAHLHGHKAGGPVIETNNSNDIGTRPINVFDHG